jgi:hypothetical protein
MPDSSIPHIRPRPLPRTSIPLQHQVTTSLFRGVYMYPGAGLPWWRNFVRRRLIFVGRQYVTCFVTFLTPRILRRLPDFLKNFCTPHMNYPQRRQIIIMKQIYFGDSSNRPASHIPAIAQLVIFTTFHNTDQLPPHPHLHIPDLYSRQVFCPNICTHFRMLFHNRI